MSEAAINPVQGEISRVPSSYLLWVREQLGWGQETMALALNVRDFTYKKWERGDVKTPGSVLPALKCIIPDCKEVFFDDVLSKWVFVDNRKD